MLRNSNPVTSRSIQSYLHCMVIAPYTSDVIMWYVILPTSFLLSEQLGRLTPSISPQAFDLIALSQLRIVKKQH